jgi:hypothetical protein
MNARLETRITHVRRAAGNGRERMQMLGIWDELGG